MRGRLRAAPRLLYRGGETAFQESLATAMSYKKIAAAFAVVGFTAVTAALAQNLPDGDGKDMVEKICSGCHDLSPITTSIGFSRADWL